MNHLLNTKVVSIFDVKDKLEADKILALIPEGQNIKQLNPVIDSVLISRYAAGWLIGHPDRIACVELVKPLNDLPIKQNKIDMTGQHYLVPQILTYQVENETYLTLPKWYYQVELISNDYLKIITFKFWSDKILSEKELLEFVENHADWTTAQEYDP